MKGKRYSTEDNIRILRQADAGQSIGEVCREHNRSEVNFQGRLRNENLNREQFFTLTKALVVIEDYHSEYCIFRPHSKLGYLSPARFVAMKTTPSPSAVGLRPPYDGDGQTNANNLQPKNNPYTGTKCRVSLMLWERPRVSRVLKSPADLYPPGS